jgi:GNAT superfamily N-acetyltransferase
MNSVGEKTNVLSYHPLTPVRWGDFEMLFGARGATGGCWCMYWRLKHAQFEAQKGEANRQEIQAIVHSGEVPGILAYDGEQPVGWCSLAPRGIYSRLERSRILKPVDDQPVWSVVCFFVDKSYRRRGVSTGLLKAAISYTREQGASILEGYPVEPKKGKSPDVFVYTGLATAFRDAGFVEVARRSETRPIMRYHISE